MIKHTLKISNKYWFDRFGFVYSPEQLARGVVQKMPRKINRKTPLSWNFFNKFKSVLATLWKKYLAQLFYCKSFKISQNSFFRGHLNGCFNLSKNIWFVNIQYCRKPQLAFRNMNSLGTTSIMVLLKPLKKFEFLRMRAQNLGRFI